MSGHQSVRVDNDTYDVLRRHAAGEDRPIARVLRSAVDLYDETRRDGAPRPETPPHVTAKLEKDAGGPDGADGALAERTDGCPHPRDAERRLAWGVVCGACGAKVR